MNDDREPAWLDTINDEDPTATALREAAEEIGIDPASVHIVGSLPPLRLRETGFLVTPVVGWCSRRQPSDNPNPEEVAGEVRIPLREFAKTSDRVQHSRVSDTSECWSSVDGIPVGEMTSIVIDVLLDHSSAAGRAPRAFIDRAAEQVG